MIGVKIFFLALISLGILLSTILINSSVATNDDMTCNLAATNVLFGNLLPDEISAADSTSDLTNTGGLSITTIEISGTDWDVGSGFLVSWTHFSETASLDYLSMKSLSSGLQSVGVTPLNPLGTATVYFKLQVPDNQPAGGYTQIITFSFTCSEVI